MTLIQQPGDGLPDNLPLLTQLADEGAPDDLPTLTEIVAEERAETAATPQPAAENETSHARFPDGTTSHSTRLSKDDNQVAGYLPNPLGETTSHSTMQQETAAKSLVIPQACEGANESLREFQISEEEMQHLLQQLEIHLENRFAHKLNLQLAKLHSQAVEQAVSELKAELPGLLRDALKSHPGL